VSEDNIYEQEFGAEFLAHPVQQLLSSAMNCCDYRL